MSRASLVAGLCCNGDGSVCRALAGVRHSTPSRGWREQEGSCIRSTHYTYPVAPFKPSYVGRRSWNGTTGMWRGGCGRLGRMEVMDCRRRWTSRVTAEASSLSGSAPPTHLFWGHLGRLALAPVDTLELTRSRLALRAHPRPPTAECTQDGSPRSCRHDITHVD